MRPFSTVLLLATLLLGACGGGGGGGSNAQSGPPPPPAMITLSGSVAYEFVPQLGINAGLDYANIAELPARGVTVEIVADLGGMVMASATTDASGDYSVAVDSNTDVFVRVRAEMVRTGVPAWDYRVVDNTNGNAQYVLDGSTFDTGVSDMSRDLVARTGWDGAAYTSARAAAPFSILDVLYQAFNLALTADPNAVFPPLRVHWSINNQPAGANLTDAELRAGNIGTSFYLRSGPPGIFASGGMFLLGAADIDTEEFDHHVIAHEWGHYFEHRFSRSDSVGGSHGLGQRLDMRLAFGEGWGNALSGMITGDAQYLDSFGAGQEASFGFDIDRNQAPANPGWFNEATVQGILYDLFDSDDEAGIDALSLGFGPIYDVLVGAQRDAVAFSSLFTFIDALKDQNAGSAASIDTLVANGSVVAATLDEYGSTETNSGGALMPSDVLPVYSTLLVNGPAVNVCSTDEFDPNQDRNKLSAWRFLRFNILTDGDYRLAATATVIPPGQTTDPEIEVYQAGFVAGGFSSVADSETLDVALTSGDYVLEVYECSNTNETGCAAAAIGRSCFDVTLVPN